MQSKAPASNSILLLVDDEEMVLAALARFFGQYFQRVVTATNSSGAEMMLQDNRVTHVICDHWLGPGQPLGIDLATKWRQHYPSIQKVVLLTGADVDSIEMPPELDCIFPKTIDPRKLSFALVEA